MRLKFEWNICYSCYAFIISTDTQQFILLCIHSLNTHLRCVAHSTNKRLLYFATLLLLLTSTQIGIYRLQLLYFIIFNIFHGIKETFATIMRHGDKNTLIPCTGNQRRSNKKRNCFCRWNYETVERLKSFKFSIAVFA